MGRIQSSVGLVTGMDIQGTVNQLMQLNSLARNRLAARNAALSNEQAALTSLTTLIVGVQLTTDRFSQASLFNGTSVSSGKSDLISARSTGSPQVGSYHFTPIRQAQTQQLTSSLVASSNHTLSAGELTIHGGGFLDQSVSLDQLNGGAGVASGFIRITDRSGTTRDVDLRFAQTAAEVVQAINSTDSLSVVAKVKDGRFVLTDVSGSTSTDLKVQEVGSGTTAHDLGLAGLAMTGNTLDGNSVYGLSENSLLRNLLDSRGLVFPYEDDDVGLRLTLQDSSQIDISTELNANTASLGQLLNALNTAGDGKIEARIAADCLSIEIQDLTTGDGEFSITSPSGNLAEQLGLIGDATAGVIESDRLISGLSDTLLSSLRGGSGFGELGSVSITDRLGQTDTIDLSSAETLQEVIDALNSGANNSSFRVQLNRSKTGIEIVDTSGGSGSLEITNADANNTATALGIEGTTSGQSVDSGTLERQYITQNTSLTDFLNGSSLAKTTFRITDSAGLSATYNTNARNPETIGDVIHGINSLGLGITARINNAGDGILLLDTAGGSGTLKVEDVGTGSAAKQLRIAGPAIDTPIDGETVSAINGSKTLRISTTAETTLADFVKQINEFEGSPLSANIINLGANGVRVQLSGRQSGGNARVAIESSVGLSFTQTAEARDALIAFGANQLGGGVIVSSPTDEFSGLVDGLEISIRGTSTSPVTVQVAKNSDGLTKQVETFIDQYNKLRDKYAELTSFNADTNEVGLLFGTNVALRLDMGFNRILTGSIRSGANATIRSLPELGINMNDQGKLSFDKTTFERQLAENPQAVQDFFMNETNGFSKRAKDVANSLAGVENGALLTRNNALQQTIEQNVSRIEAWDVRLERQREMLLKQFYGMEQAIAKLQTNLSSVSQLQYIAPI